MSIKRKVVLGGAIVGALLLAAVPASAAVYIYDFDSTDGYGLDGTITTSNTLQAIPGAGSALGYAIQSITGTLTGPGAPAPDTIDQLIPNPNFPNSSYSGSGYFIYDDALFFPTQPYLDNPGVLFSTNALPGIEWNLYSQSATLYTLYNNTGFNTSGTMRLYDPVATPLPAALPLFAAGLGVMGLLGRRRKHKNSTALASA
jgi:hypothetical protein